MSGFRYLSVCLVVSLFSGCGFNSTDPVQTAVAGGAGGAAIGAGTGAIVGSLIANGDVGASALLGTAIGLPVGAAIGYYYISTTNDSELETLDDIIKANQEEIIRTERDLLEARRAVDDESFVINPDSSTREELYTGPTLGDPTR